MDEKRGVSMKMTKPYQEKFLWSSVNFIEWVKSEQNKLKKNGVSMPTSGITEKLLNDFLVPMKVEFQPPKINIGSKKR